MRVLFLSSAQRKIDGSRLYRCDYQAKQLQQAGLEASVAYVADATEAQVAAADVLIFSRCVYEPHTVALVDAARKRGCLVCADLDDKIYAPWDVDAVGYLRGVQLLTGESRERHGMAEGQRKRLHLLPMFDLVLVSTPALADELRELGLTAQLARNAFDTDVARPLARDRVGLHRILVMAGTKTHDADVRVLGLPLARFLTENQQVECTFLGPISLSQQLSGLRNLVRQELVPMARLPSFIATHDLCLVPLENSAFNDCKSAIKFVECGLVSVPVAASPRREFRELLVHRENGFLSGDEPETWYRLLCELRDQPKLLGRAARGAHETVLANHTVVSRGSQLADYLRTALKAKRAGMLWEQP